MELSVTLAGVKLEHPLMNAGGTCKTLEDVERFARSAVSAIVVGPATPFPREINKGNVYWQGPFYSLNSLGMPNYGPGYYAQHLPQMVEIAHAAGKPLIFQIAGFGPEDYGLLTKLGLRFEVDFIEFNLGCPNVWDGGKQKGIASFDTGAIVAIVNTAERNMMRYCPYGLKLSPYSDPDLLARVAETINNLNLPVDYVALSNTFPNAMVLDAGGHPVITSGLAGLSGLAMKPIALGQVYQFVPLLESVEILGVGGVTNGTDVLDFQRAGAVAVQASTIFWNAGEDPGIYSTVLADYIDVAEAVDAARLPEG